MAESLFSSLAAELLAQRRFTTQAAACMAWFSCIEGFCDPVRLPSALGYRSPIAGEEQAAMTAKAEPWSTSPSSRHVTRSTPRTLRAMMANGTAYAASRLAVRHHRGAKGHEQGMAVG